MSMEAETQAPRDADAATRRSWQDLDPRRLAIGLAVAPVFPAAIGYGLVPLEPDEFFTGGATFSFAWVAGSAVLWSLAFGTFFLVTSPRRSGSITRAQCIFLGGLAAILFPSAFMVFAAVITAEPATLAMAIAFSPISLLLGLFLTPLGVFGGWVFWLVGVRPAKPHMDQLEKVFE